jgi:hypothetical protein
MSNIIKSRETKVGFGKPNTSTEVNKKLDKAIHDLTELNVATANAAIDAQTTWYVVKALESHIHDQVSNILTAAAGLYRPSTFTLVPRSQGIRTPMVGGVHYEVDSSSETTATVLSDFGHILPGIKLQENKLLYIDGTLPDSFKAEVSYSPSSAITNYVAQSDPTRVATGKGWISIVNLSVSDLSSFSTVLKVSLPTDVISSSRFNNITIKPVHGTYIKQIGTTETGTDIADFTSGLYAASSEPVDIHFPTIQSEVIYIHLGSTISASTSNRNKLDVITGIIELGVYYNEYQADSQFNIQFYDYVDDDSDDLVEATMRPHIPEVYFQQQNADKSYSSILDDGSRCTSTINGDGSITITISNTVTDYPVIIDKVKVALT